MTEERPELRVLSQGHAQVGLDHAIKVTGEVLDLVINVAKDATINGIVLVRCY